MILRQAGERSLLAVLLCLFTFYGSVIAEQQQISPTLERLIASSQHPINDVRQLMPTELFVRTTDENNRPVAGAFITFRLPQSGAGGSFVNGAKTATVVTDQNGEARVTYTPNQIDGTFVVDVTAAYQGKTLRTTIPQKNIMGRLPPITPTPKWLIILLLGITPIPIITLGLKGNGRDTTRITLGPSTVNAAQ